ncbi:MAG: DUF3556 domain-containing protein [Myxococcota bacterium]
MWVRPRVPEYDIAEWRRQPFPDRVRAVCRAWALQGYGSPIAVYLAYVSKIAAYIAAWVGFCVVGPERSIANLPTWWASDVAFQKAVLWTMLFEGLGFGCGSGPLTGRYLPPMGGALYFLRPGTTKLPPWFGGHRRTLLDVALYAITVAALVRALVAPVVGLEHVLPLVVLVPVLGVLDKTLFLVFRSEHYWSVLICLLFPDWLAGVKVVWLAIWWWAATSKVNAHFPAVMAVMVSNSPFSPTALKKAMYLDFPDDLRPSRLASGLAHLGTALEYAFPLVLVLSDGGPVTWVTLGVMTVFHLFILSEVPMGVPLEWNVIMIYGGWVLFGVHADTATWAVSSPGLLAWLGAFHLALPLWGSLYPSQVSFLLAMRYYAGNWAYSVWLFRDGASAKLDQLVKSSGPVREQLGWLYDTDTVDALLSKVVAFRLMHLHGRALHDLLPRAVPSMDGYEWLDGEVVAGMVVGWNFGDGHLHDRQLLQAVQAQCRFLPGELRVVMVESQPLFGSGLAWTIADAHDGELAAGETAVATLSDRQPFPPPA